MSSGRAAVANVPCPHCGYAYSRQTSTRATPDGYLRKRSCLAQDPPHQFVTYEIPARSIRLLRNIRKWNSEEG